MQFFIWDKQDRGVQEGSDLNKPQVFIDSSGDGIIEYITPIYKFIFLNEILHYVLHMP